MISFIRMFLTRSLLPLILGLGASPAFADLASYSAGVGGIYFDPKDRSLIIAADEIVFIASASLMQELRPQLMTAAFIGGGLGPIFQMQAGYGTEGIGYRLVSILSIRDLLNGDLSHIPWFPDEMYGIRRGPTLGIQLLHMNHRTSIGLQFGWTYT